MPDCKYMRGPTKYLTIGWGGKKRLSHFLCVCVCGE